MESWPSYVAAQHFDPVPLHASGRLSPDQGPHWSDENPRPKENMGLMQSDVAWEIWTSLDMKSAQNIQSSQGIHTGAYSFKQNAYIVSRTSKVPDSHC